MLGLAFRQTQGPELQPRGSGLTLSGALHPALKGGAWRRRMGQHGPFILVVHSPSPGCPVPKHGEEWREVTAAQPAGRSRVASAQFRLALPRMPRGEAQGASLSFSNPRVNKIFSFKFEEGGAPPAKLNGKSPWVAHRDQV
jgi:hypothetical protein